MNKTLKLGNNMKVIELLSVGVNVETPAPPYDCVAGLTAFTRGELDPEGEVELFQNLVAMRQSRGFGDPLP